MNDRPWCGFENIFQLRGGNMVEKVIRYLILPLFILGCTAFDLEEYNASVAADALEIKRVAVIDFSFDLPERGRIDRGKIQRPQNAGVLVIDR